MDIHIKGDRIAKISPTEEAAGPAGAEVIEVGGRLVIPGFVDAHMHLDKGMVSDRTVNRSGTLEEGLEIMMAIKKGVNAILS